MIRWIKILVGSVLILAAVVGLLILSYSFLADEMTQGAFMKKYWVEELVCAVAIWTGAMLTKWK